MPSKDYTPVYIKRPLHKKLKALSKQHNIPILVILTLIFDKLDDDKVDQLLKNYDRATHIPRA